MTKALAFALVAAAILVLACGGEPRVCAKCKSPYWNTPRTRGRAKSSGGGEESGVAQSGS